MIDLLALLKLQGSKCVFNQFCCACRGHHCERHSGDAVQLLALCTRGDFGSWYHLKNSNVQQIPSYKSLLGETLMLQMHRVPCPLEIWFFPAPWILWASFHLAMGHSESMLKTAECNFGLPYERFWSKKREAEFLRSSAVGKCMDWCTRWGDASNALL